MKYTTLMVAVCAIAILSCSPTATTTPTIIKPPVDIKKGLIAHYPLDGNAKNAVADEHNGRVNEATPTENRSGEEDKAMEFDGQSYIDLGLDFPSLGGTKKYTISVWFKTNEPGAIVSRWRRATETEFVLNVAPDGATSLQRSGSGRCDGPNKFADGEWHHFLAINNGVNYLYYIDGVLECRNDVKKIAGVAKNTQVMIGCVLKQGGKPLWKPINSSEAKQRMAGNAPFVGSIDDLRFYNRAVNKAEVKALFELK